MRGINKRAACSCHVYSTWQITFQILTYLALGLFLNGMIVCTSDAASIVRANHGENWRYFKGAKNPPQKWNHKEFDDSQWLKGSKGIGYWKNQSPTVLDDMKGKYRRVYARRSFYIQNPQAVRVMNLSVVCDGPFVAYLNGMMAIRNVTGLSTANPVKGGDPIGEELDISGWAHELNSGHNVLSVQCDNEEINSDDFIFIPSLKIIEDNSAK